MISNKKNKQLYIKQAISLILIVLKLISDQIEILGNLVKQSSTFVTTENRGPAEMVALFSL